MPNNKKAAPYIRQIRNVADKSENMGDAAYKMWRKNQDIATAKVAISAYKNVLWANALLIRGH